MKLTGIAAAPGVATGPVFAHVPQEVAPAEERILESDVSRKLALFEEAVGCLVERLKEDQNRLRAEEREEAAEILEAHEELAQDPALVAAGATELSMAPPMMPWIKKLVGGL